MHVSHRALRANLRDIEGYRELSDAIRAKVNEVAPKAPHADQLLGALCWIAADPEAYARLNSLRRELIRTLLWTDAARVVAGIVQPDDTEIHKVAGKLTADISASVIAKQALGLIQTIEEDDDDSDNDGDDNTDNEGAF